MSTEAPAAHTPPRTQPLAACPLCHGKRFRPFFRASDRLHGTPGEFTYCRCRTCGTTFQNPRVAPEDLSACYPPEYGTHQPVMDDGAALPPTRTAGWIGRILAFNRTVRERTMPRPIFTELLPPATASADRRRALDVGCGAGGMMVALSRLGWQVEGVEWDPAAAAVARAVSGLNVREGDFRQVDLPPTYYDLIVLSHCFEHLDDPLGALRRLRELLKNNGRLVLIYPNPRSLGARLYGRSWFDWDPPRHLVIPPLSSLAQAAERLGFRVTTIRTLAREAYEHLVHSRAIHEGKPPAGVRVPTAQPRDVQYARLEHILTALGFRLGEEAVLVLEAATDTR